MALASISVVIPAYNAAKTIREAIQSVLEQTLAVDQVVVVDDGSLDETVDVVRMAFPSVEVETIPNGGPSRARNYGVTRCRGDWVAFLDADDRWHPEKLRVQMAVSSQDVEFVASDWIRGAAFGSVPEVIPTSKLQYRDLLAMNQFQTSTVVMSRRLAEMLHGFDPDVDGAEDWDFWLRASEKTGILKVDWPLVQYRDVVTGYSKDVRRVYRTMQPMLNKHRGTRAITPREFGTLEAWHHLRFWVAFTLSHDREYARVAWKNAWQRRLRGYVWGATTGYLVPFLLKRVKRRRG